ncbi:MAG TPA: HGxxPAAW family protein [Streptosporangiaceae bacterium]
MGGVKEGSHAGRPRSWFAVGVMLVGFALGGVGLVVGPSWPLFWAGVAIAAVGGFLALAVGILSDVIVYSPVDIASDSGRTPGEMS